MLHRTNSILSFLLLIPNPFSRALMRVSRKIAVPPDANETERERSLQALQAALDRCREFAEANLHRAGSPDFPVYVRRA